MEGMPTGARQPDTNWSQIRDFGVEIETNGYAKWLNWCRELQ